jgi:hypothetical protein
VDFLLKLYHALKDESPYSIGPVVQTLQQVQESVDEAIKAHDSIPLLDDGPLKWLWINEMTRHDIILTKAFGELDKLERCVVGAKVLDDSSHALAKILTKGYVPKDWLGQSSATFSASNFVRMVNERTHFYQVRCLKTFFKKY